MVVTEEQKSCFLNILFLSVELHCKLQAYFKNSKDCQILVEFVLTRWQHKVQRKSISIL
jgi:hypothetical protein